MDFKCTLFSFIVILSLSLVNCRFTYVVTAPNIFRTDTINTVIVTATHVRRPQTIHLKISSGKIHLPEKVTFVTDGLQKVEFFLSAKSLSPHDMFVDLDITHGSEKSGKSIPITKSSGYIFIQTDKPIYTPRGTVKYRILAVNEDQGATSRRVRVDIVSPNGIILDMMTYLGHDAFNNKTFHLPKEAELGIWKITASYEDGTCAKSVDFEVEEYVLPTFKVFVEPSVKIIMKSLSYFTINVNATYVYGKGVKGRCSVRIGVMNGGNANLFNRTYTATLQKGKASFSVYTRDLSKASLWFPSHGSPLYIEANVTEIETDITESTVDISSIFANSFYNIDFTSSKSYFKPGKPYMLEVDVTDTMGRPKSYLHLYIKTVIDGLPSAEDKVTKSDKNGHIDVLITNIPYGCRNIKFTVSEVISLDPMLMSQESKQFDLTPSSGNSISLAENIRRQVHTDMEVNIQYTHSRRRTMFFLVLSKGQIVFADSFPSSPSGSNKIKIPEKYRADLSPFARIIVYYHGLGELEAESITADFPSRCLEDLSLRHSRFGAGSVVWSSPKKKAAIKISGGPHMRVGLVAVDQAVYYLNKEISLTRNSLFEQLGNHDKGKRIIQSQTAEEIFQENGLICFDNFKSAFFDSIVPNFGSQINFSQGYGASFGRFQSSHRRTMNKLPFIRVNDYDTVPAKKIRKYFPESWLFEDLTLSRRGRHTEIIQLPDSITTWVVHAVGISATRGVCVASPIEFIAYMSVFVQLHLPYKAVRLEQVKARLVLYNYRSSRVKVNINITADLGLCFPKCRQLCKEINIERAMNIDDVRGYAFDVIPLMTGDLTIRVEVRDDQKKIIDVIEKKLYVVPEGKRLRKTITFPLDPEGSHFSAKRSEKVIVTGDSLTINNTIIGGQKSQKTEIDLALPSEIIPGTESCSIQAYGDLMGDIINSALLGTGNVFVSSFYDAEGVIGNLAPTVHALEYLNSSNVLIGDTSERGRRYIIEGVTRLMKYRHKNGAYGITDGAPSATWFTALVLKTLCHTRNITFVDEKLINQGFLWLLDQVDEDGRPSELEYRLAGSSKEYNVMLAADILIALKECNMPQQVDHQQLEITLIIFLEDEIQNIKNPLVLSKIAYALQISESPEVDIAIAELVRAAKKSSGLTYWSEHRSEERIPYWYRQGADAFSIETTAYALLVYLRNKNLDPHPLAEWLVRQRNRNGGFVSPIDTSVAIQALAEFSALKHSTKTDLQLEISSDPSINYNHILAFNTENAIQQKQVTDVPIGERLNVKTNGTGLGQMQIQVAYNVPTAPNGHCMYHVTIERKAATLQRRFDPEQISLCKFCNFGCALKDKLKKEETIAELSTRPPIQIKNSMIDVFSFGGRVRTKRRANRRHKKKSKRSTISKISICLKICLRYRGVTKSGPTNVEIEMLSGYTPIQEDLSLLSISTNGRARSYRYNREHLTVYLNEVPNNETVCLQLRIKEEERVKYLQPASVVAFQPSKPEEICLQNYNSGEKANTLPMFCLNQNQRYKGECTCISGLCGTCPSKYIKVKTHELKEKLCYSDFVYGIGVRNTEKTASSKYISAVVKETHKLGSHTVHNDYPILLTTSLDCSCPNFNYGESVVMIGTNPTRFMTRNKEEVYRYIVDETTTFVNVTDFGEDGNVLKSIFKYALNNYHKSCEKP